MFFSEESYRLGRRKWQTKVQTIRMAFACSGNVRTSGNFGPRLLALPVEYSVPSYSLVQGGR
jgi:hypothetical protein